MMFQQLSSPVRLMNWTPVREAATGAEVQPNTSSCTDALKSLMLSQEN